MRQFSLYHVSETPNINRFDPRPSPDPFSDIREPVVWAIDGNHLPNYLLPRDCPRITYYAGQETSREDKNRFFAGSTAKRIVAIEANWISRLWNCQLFVYHFPTDHFLLRDAVAGYYISVKPVIPLYVQVIQNIPQELLKHDVELRVMSSLWKLQEEVAASSLHFSIIRMRNAQPKKILTER